jgi:hypothetical protein
MNAAGIARNLGATRQAHNWRAPCPLGCGYALSLCDGEDGRLLAHCFGGCDPNQVLSALVEYGLLDDDGGDSQVSRSVAVCQPADPTKIARAQELYASGVEDERIGSYLRSRGISRTSTVLKFLEQAPHRLGARLPAMLAPVVNAAVEQTGVHMTYLRPDGRGKADLPKEYQRECRGVIHGGAIRLMEHDPDAELVIAEGVETSLAASEIFDLSAWSAVYAGGLKTVELPREARRILIAADNDVSGVGQRNALAAYDRWTAEGRSVRIKTPPDVGTDFNNLLLMRRADARP